MDAITALLLGLVVGLILGAALVYFLLSSRQSQALAQSRETTEARLRGELGSELERLRTQLSEREAQHSQRIADLDRESAMRLDQAQAMGDEQMRAERELSRERLEQAEAKLAELKLAIEQSQQALAEQFKALANDALKSNNRDFLQLASTQLEGFQKTAQGDLEQRRRAVEELVKPITEKLGSFDKAVREIELKREGAYERLAEQIRNLHEAEAGLHEQADNLSRALRSSPTRWGRWGEMQLRNVIELAGMQEHCDFVEQQSLPGEGLQRPDVTIRLPGGKSIAIDSKAPLEAYLTYNEAETDEQRKAALEKHAKNIRKHIGDLASKDYWKRIEGSPEFVVMFIPGESFFSAAVTADPGLIDFGVSNRVMPASPTTLIALLKAVSYGWNQEQLAQNAREISDLGRELYDRMRVLAEHLRSIGKHLGSATEAYNRAVGSIETRVLPQARRFKELGAGTKDEIEELEPVDVQPRRITASDLGLEALPLELTGDATDEADSDESTGQGGELQRRLL